MRHYWFYHKIVYFQIKMPRLMIYQESFMILVREIEGYQDPICTCNIVIYIL